MAKKCPKCHHENPDDTIYCGKCATPLHPSNEIGVTKTIETPTEEYPRGSTFANRYKIIEKIGAGGMGAVYRVEDTNIGQDIALKLIKTDIASDKKTIERFRNELKTTRMISHRNVCRMFDLAETEGTYYITMEYVPGEDLKNFIRRSGKLDIPKTISIAKEVCEGLSEAHRLGVVHRDLKPSNIMIDKEGNARIMDFGIARSLEAKGITGAGVMIGTPEYMSPEQVEGKEVDQRSDIYSLGVILYEMLTGRVPFEGDTPFTIGMKHKSEFPKNPKELNPQTPDVLCEVILKCLEKEKENRYRNDNDVISELEKIEQGLPSSEHAIPQKKPLTSHEMTVQLNVKKLLYPALAVIALAVIALVIWSLWKPTPILKDKPFLAVLYFENITGDDNLDIWKHGLSKAVITDLSQSKYIQVLSSERLLSILNKLNKLNSTDYSNEDLETVAAESGVNYILTGRVFSDGGKYRIDFTLHDILRKEISGSDWVVAEDEDNIYSKVDEITLKVKEIFNLSETQLADDVDREVWRITTAKPEAYKYYIEAEQQEILGFLEQKIQNLEEAIEIDPEFAMAYRMLSYAYANSGNYKKRDFYMTKAYELRNRVPEIEKRWITADYLRLVEGDYEKAIAAYQRLFELDPNHPIGHYNLSGLYNSLGDTDKAIEHREIGRQNQLQLSGLISRLGENYEEKGMYEKAHQVYQEYIDDVQDNALMNVQNIVSIREEIAWAYCYEGKYNEAFIELDKALELDPTSGFKGGIYHLQGNFEAAETDYISLLDKEGTDSKMEARRNLEILYRTLGRYEKAKKEAQAGLEYAQKIKDRVWQRIFWHLLAVEDLMTSDLNGVLNWAEKIQESAEEDETLGWQRLSLWLKGVVKLEQNSIEEALDLAAEVKKIVDSTSNTKDIWWYWISLGLIDVKRGNYSEAIDLFIQAYELLGEQRTWIHDHALILDNLASAYYLDGNLDAARTEYENILDLTTGRVFWGDLYVKSHYQIGKIYEQQGDTAKAIEHYERFLTLWKDADPGIAEVEDAKKRLAGLIG